MRLGFQEKSPVPPEYEDEETKAYRKKIEEQKRLREKILQQKEERRKQTAQLNEAQSTSEDFKEIVKKAASIQADIVTKPQNIQVKASLQFPRLAPAGQNQPRLVAPNTSPNILITQKNELAAQPRRIVLKPSNPQNNRRVVYKNQSVPQIKSDGKDNLESFLSNRKVVEQRVIATGTVGNSLIQGALIKTPVVTVSNLAATTTDVKLRKLCQGLGPIQVSLTLTSSI